MITVGALAWEAGIAQATPPACSLPFTCLNCSPLAGGPVCSNKDSQEEGEVIEALSHTHQH